MGRYSGTLHKLAEAGPAKKGNWNLLINYLEGYAVADRSAINPKFESPLPPYTSPNADLGKELIDPQGPKREDTPLRIAVRTAPASVIGALCHMGPEATRMTDSKGRLPLHLACCRSSADEQTDAVLKILVLAHPEGLLHRDDGGRTPLHYLMWHHTSTRSGKLVEFFCQPLPQQCFAGIKQPPQSKSEKSPLPEIPTPNHLKKVPCSAVIVHDMKHGALPLHYAAAEGASKEVIKLLLSIYPASRGLRDRKGRTPLAWFLGAGALVGTHVSGEAVDPNAKPVWEKRMSNSIVQLLLSSKVARTPDDTGRFPLHWAMHLMARYYYNVTNVDHSSPSLALASVQLMLDNHVEALTTRDLRGMTPLHVLFDAVGRQQQTEWVRMSRNKTFRDDVDLVMGGSRFRPAYEPPTQLVEMLLKPPDCNVSMLAVGERPTCAAHVEDVQGRLPLHIALHVATAASVVKLLIQSHPTSLLHTTEEQLQSPLHMALSSAYATPLQTLDTVKLLMQAYVTSRHGTFVDGRLALKMEDAFGQYPLHYACENQASLEVTKLLFMSYPKAATYQNALGDHPLHCFLDASLFGSADRRGLTIGATLATPMGWTSETEDSFRAEQLRVTQEKMSMLIEPVCMDKEAMKTASATHGMLPLHIAVAFDAVPYATLYRMMQTYPDAVKSLTTAEGHAYSPMDLHEMRRPAAQDEDEWHMVRELLFSCGPTLDAHRTQDELLERCARIVRDELEGRGSTHATALWEAENFQIQGLDLTETLSSIEVPEIDRGGRTPRTPKTPKTPKTTGKAKAVKSPTSKKKSPAKKSIYDDDADLGYTVSPDVSFNDDDYFSDEQSKEEEYFSDEYDSRYDDDSMFDDEDDEVAKNRSHRKIDPIDKSRADAEKAEKAPQVKTEQEEATVSLTSTGTYQQSPQNVTKPFLSDVALRLWVFFAMFKDPSNLDDNYAKQVDFVLDHLKFTTAQKLLMLPLPDYASEYSYDGRELKGLTVQDVANANCKAIMHRVFHFVGRFEFRSSQSESILIHRSMDGDTVTVRATEHVSNMVETVEEEDPGHAEAAIWATGSVPEAPVMKRSFRVSKRPVCFKFMKNANAYASEVECRKAMGVSVEDEAPGVSHIAPLIGHFNSQSSIRHEDERYRQDIQDDRFQLLNLYSDEDDEDNTIFLPDFPYAVVMPYLEGGGDLNEHLFRHGALGMDKIREIGCQVGRSLLSMHEKGLVHGNVSLRNVAGVPLQEDTPTGTGRYWALSDLSCATRQTSQVFYMAPVSDKGSVQFSTSTFPPEMFVKLTPGELKMYNEYWEAVESQYNVSVDKAVITPHLDRHTGDAYVLRCHLARADAKDLPPLPYKLLPTQESADIWSFGRFLFTLCSSGHPLFPTNLRTGHLIQYDQVATWDKEMREMLIYEHVEDPLAQDLLLRILSSHDERSSLSMETILSHPFFLADTPTGVDNVTSKLIEKRTSVSLSRKRAFAREAMQKSEEKWLKERSTTLHSWDLDFQMRMHMAPSQFAMRELAGGNKVGIIPYGVLVLPYKLVRNKAGRLTPSTKSDVELAERMGAQLLGLSKACRFARCLQEAVEQAGPSHKWSLSEISDAVSGDHFKELHSEMVTFASDKVEIFRDNPLLITRRIVQERISELQCLFEETGRAYLYLVDEYEGIPIVGSASKSTSVTYPIEVTTKVSDLVSRSFTLMHLCILYARGVAADASGLVKLIFEAAFPHIPPSWTEAANALTHSLDETEMKQELEVLREALGTRSIDDLRFIQSYLEGADVKRSYANLQRVTNAADSIWTSENGVQELKELAESHGMEQANRRKRSQEKKLLKQARKIAELEEALEALKFRREHNLKDYPIAS